MSQLASSLSERPKKILPSQLLIDSKNLSEAHVAQDQQINQCNVVHTLRSEKQIDKQLLMPSTPIQHNPSIHFFKFYSLHSNWSEKDKPIRCISL